MDIQIEVGERTKEQRDIEAWSYECAKILRENGYDVKVISYCVTSPKDYPCGIQITGKS